VATLVRCDLAFDGCEGDIPAHASYGLDVEVRLPTKGERAQVGPYAGELVPGGRLSRHADACESCISKIGPLADLFSDAAESRAALTESTD
jgi:hypothetical protein